MIEGKIYRFTLLKVRDLRDAGKRLENLDGWMTPIFKITAGNLRFPDAPYFALIGTVNEKHPFQLHPKPEYPDLIKSPATGELSCYFNDPWLMYCNNGGAAEIQIEEV